MGAILFPSSVLPKKEKKNRKRKAFFLLSPFSNCTKFAPHAFSNSNWAEERPIYKMCNRGIL